MKDLKDADVLEGRSDSFRPRFKYSRDAVDQKKTATMTARVNGMVTASRASKRELWSLKTAKK